jgi:hypothetical protein
MRRNAEGAMSRLMEYDARGPSQGWYKWWRREKRLKRGRSQRKTRNPEKRSRQCHMYVIACAMEYRTLSLWLGGSGELVARERKVSIKLRNVGCR